VGGGAAGFFAAITAAESRPGVEVSLYEQGAQFLSKVRISGGGRCNVTHSCFEVRDLVRRYPRGGQALIGPLNRFQPRDTVAWFAARGVELKTEPDGRMFPTTDSSATIVDCLMRAAAAAGVRLFPGRGVVKAERRAAGGFEVGLSDGSTVNCDRLMLATGGCRTVALGRLAAGLGHTLEPPVPSLFAFDVAAGGWMKELAGVAVDPVQVTVPGTTLKERGPLLITHRGLSGPAVLRLSAWGARELSGMGYKFPLRIDWLAGLDDAGLIAAFEQRRQEQGARLVANGPIAPLTGRLWERLVAASGLPREARWAALTREARERLTRQLRSTEVAVDGKSLNQDEFVTCGGVRLAEIHFKRMESRVCPGLHFAGELLDIDGITGGFNFQAAWTTGWIAGQAMAEAGVEGES
jgi:hypothetical protein